MRPDPLAPVDPKRFGHDIAPSIWQSMTIQGVGCILLALIGPLIVRSLMSDESIFLPLMQQTIISSLVAIMLGIALFRSLSNYPGIEATSYILPSFLLAFTVILGVLVFGRIQYNRFVLLSCFLITIMWFYYVNFMIQQQRALRIGFVPMGQVDHLEAIPHITWVRLESNDASLARVDAVVADLRIDLPSEWDVRLADYALGGTPVYHVKSLLESLTGRVELEHLSENSFGSLTPVRAYATLKAIVDALGAAVAIVVLFPFLVLVGMFIRWDSPGPAIFRQQRIGYRGRPFTVFKFRTMARSAPSDDPRAAAITQAGDRRITRFGRFLRRARIDELPQIINIIRGEMSWIGPRPEAAVLSRWYEAEIPFYRYRHIVRPGITGWAQVNQGHVAAVDEVRAKLHYDFYYIKNFSPWIDMLIVARTVNTMLSGFGSR